jgi:gamma-glutamyl-gamma-aminobutyrate hydrolase PuuD
MIAIAPPYYKELLNYTKWLNKRKLQYKVIEGEERLTSDDILLLCGGADVGKRVKRDTREFRLIAEAIKLEIPILGICRGMQIVNVFLGGTLVDDIVSESLTHASNKKSLSLDENLNTTASNFHQVKFVNKIFSVNSRHHQCINECGTGVNIIAKSKDNNPEAATVGQNIFLVQWHPERDEVYDTLAEKIISNWLILKNKRYDSKKCRERISS